MGEASSLIERHIAEERDLLDRDLRQMEQKIKKKAASLRRNSALLAGISMAAGVLLFLMVRRWTRT